MPLKTFRFEGEDDTLGNAVRHVLSHHRHVTFAGYRRPHPSKPLLEVRVDTSWDSTPDRALRDGLVALDQWCDETLSLWSEQTKKDE